MLNKILRDSDAAIDTSGGAASAQSLTVTLDNPVLTDEVSLSDELPIVTGDKVKTSAELAKEKIASKKKIKGAPSEESLKETIDFDDLDDNTIITQKKLDKDKAAQSKEIEDDKKALSDDKAKLASGKVDDKSKQQSSRDYSFAGIDDNLIKLLKSAPNALFDHLKVLIPKHKELETKISELEKGIVKVPESYYENPQAYTLTADYQSNVVNYRQAEMEARHWLQQKKNASEGLDWTNIEGITKEGKLILSKPMKSDTFEAKHEIDTQLQAAEGYKQKFLSDIQLLQTNHVGKHKEIVGKVRNDMAKFFPWVGDKKLLETKMDIINPLTQKPESLSPADLFKLGANLIHPSLRNSPMTEVYSNMFTLLAIQNKKLSDLENAAEVKQVNTQHQEDAEPAGKSKSSGARGDAKAASNKIDSIDDMYE